MNFLNKINENTAGFKPSKSKRFINIKKNFKLYYKYRSIINNTKFGIKYLSKNIYFRNVFIFIDYIKKVTEIKINLDYYLQLRFHKKILK